MENSAYMESIAGNRAVLAYDGGLRMNRLPEPEWTCPECGEAMPLLLSDDPACHKLDCEYCEKIDAARLETH